MKDINYRDDKGNLMTISLIGFFKIPELLSPILIKLVQ